MGSGGRPRGNRAASYPKRGCLRQGLREGLQQLALREKQDFGLGPRSVARIPDGAAPGLTVKDRPAVLGGGGQRQARGVELVAIVPNADLELDGIVHILEHGGRVEGGKEGVLTPPEILLGAERAADGSWEEEGRHWGGEGSHVWQALAVTGAQ